MICIEAGGINLAFDFSGDLPVRLLHLGKTPFDPTTIPEDRRWAYRLVELRVTGEDHDYLEAGRCAGSAVGGRLRYVSHSDSVGAQRLLTILQRDELSGMEVTSRLSVMHGVVESRTSVVNRGSSSVTLEAVSSFFLTGVTKEGSSARGERAAVMIPRNGWYAEAQWVRTTADDLGLNSRYGFGSRHETIASTGNWCSSNYLPMGYIENVDTGAGLMWEILHGGSWSWQIGETANELYLHVAGPTEAQSRWWKTLAPGDSFDSVPVAVAPGHGFDDAIAALTRHRRTTRPRAAGPGPVVFNDYMNCLMGDPSEQAVMPLIDVAAGLGAEVYCMDAGWYAPPGQRWSAVLGDWTVDQDRFPNGLEPIVKGARDRGMVAGLWFEIEAMTANCPGFSDLPDDWFFTRHGKRLCSHRRYQLDFRNPEVRAYADRALNMAVGQLGFGYLKFDYNFESGAGSEHGAESLGEALLDYQTSFLGWLDGLKRRYPELMIEHCASGGMRLARPYLDRTDNASNSDEGDPLEVARIAAAATTIILPEQNGTWALPNADFDEEMTAFAMLCALPYRMLIAGGAAGLRDRQRALVMEAIELHKQLRDDLAEAVPIWPLGLPRYHDKWVCAGLRSPRRLYLMLWHRGSGFGEIEVPLKGAGQAQLLYPVGLESNWSREDGQLRLSLNGRAARMLAFDLEPDLVRSGENRR